MVSKAFTVLFVAACISTLSTSKPTEYSQCDSHWKNQYLSLNSTWPSICDSGDQLTVLSMLVDGCKLNFPGTKDRVDPGTLNTWLSSKNGFNPDMSIDIPTFSKIGIEFKFEAHDIFEIKKLFKYNTYAVALQNKAGEWYALKSYSTGSLVVTDPKGQKQNMDNNDFKLGLVFFSYNCAKGGRGDEFLTE